MARPLNRCGDVSFELVFSKRKTLEISVHPDKRVIVKAPEDCTVEDVKKRVKKRSGWIKKQMRYFEQFHPRTPPRRYVGGESHLYMGRSYRLKIEPSEPDGVTLKGGRLIIKTSNADPEKVKLLSDGWYAEKTAAQFEKIFEECWNNFEKKGFKNRKPKLKIRSMKTRWGSLSTRGNLTLNSELIKAPRQCIEYVVIHELCHLAHHNHGRDFYRLLDTSLPDWTKRKHLLETKLA